MRFELLDLQTEPAGTATIRRISAFGTRWRVCVEVRRGATGWAGRLVFEPESPGTRHGTRHGAFTLRGRSREEVLDAAHEIPERRYHEILQSLG